jgi:hypothetical protein
MRKPCISTKTLLLQANRTDMKALWEHCGDGKSPIRGQRMAYPLERGWNDFCNKMTKINSETI